MSEQLETVLSGSDEAAGKIVVRGRDLAVLSQDESYEDVVALLWDGVVDTRCTPGALGAARAEAFAGLAGFERQVAGLPTRTAMRILLAGFAPGAADPALTAVAWTGLAAVLAMRAEQGLAWLGPDAAAGHAADLLRMALGHAPEPRIAHALERYMILMVDHGISASTYAARIAASTGADLGACLMAALMVLNGPSHGGAPSLVLDQLDKIAGANDVPRAVAEIRASGGRVMGFGSRAYRGEDLRSALMRREWLAIDGARAGRAEAEAIEAAIVAELARINPSRPLRANVEYFAALLVEAIGIPRPGLTPLFAAARSAGWVAHAAEQRAHGRMIRPNSLYTGARSPPILK